MLRKVYENVLNRIVPPFCFYCHTFLNERLPLCVKCKSMISPVLSEEIRLSASNTMRVFAIAAYEEPLKTLILAKNYGNSFASRQLGLLIASNLSLNLIACDVLIPIPLHWTRYAKRGFNQAEVIARVLGNSMKKPVINALKRVKRTRLQSSVEAHERFSNIQEAFELYSGHDLRGKHVVLVDDLMTTGATLAMAAKVVYAALPASVSAIVGCRAL